MSLSSDAIIGLVTLLVGLPPSILLVYRWVHRRKQPLEDTHSHPIPNSNSHRNTSWLGFGLNELSTRAMVQLEDIEREAGMRPSPSTVVVLHRASGKKDRVGPSIWMLTLVFIQSLSILHLLLHLEIP